MKYSAYSLQQLEEFLFDALNVDDVSANDIYSVIINTLQEHEDYHNQQSNKARQLLKLMSATVEPWTHPESNLEFTIEDMIKEDPHTYGYEWTPLP